MKTKQDFETVADIISLIPKGGKRKLALSKAKKMFSDNPRFDFDRFSNKIDGKDNKKWNGIDKELKIIEETLSELGAIASVRIHNRLKELFVKLSKFKRVKLNYLVMGNGVWAIDGTVPFKEYGFKGEIYEGEHEIETDSFTSSRSGWVECYENVNPGICAVVAEIESLLMILTDEKYLTLLDINNDEMKKLIGAT